jgi:hypothetical protein
MEVARAAYARPCSTESTESKETDMQEPFRIKKQTPTIEKVFIGLFVAFLATLLGVVLAVAGVAAYVGIVELLRLV